MFRSFIHNGHQKQPECPSIGDQIDKLWYPHRRILYYSATRKEQTMVIESESGSRGSVGRNYLERGGGRFCSNRNILHLGLGDWYMYVWQHLEN